VGLLRRECPTGRACASQRAGRDAGAVGSQCLLLCASALVVGIVLVALGLKEVLLYVSDSSHHSLTDPLPTVALVALAGGVIVYLLGHVLFKWLTVHTVSVVRLAAAGVLLAVTPLIAGLPALAELGVVAIVVTGAVAIESLIFAESRRKVRAELSHH
jgi:Bacterial low temperature requirement A protein (LtrA)